MSELIYEASVYTRTVAYKNFKGETNEIELHFALDPLQLMQTIAGFNPKASKSGNPAKAGQTEISDAEQLKFIRDLAVQSAGTPSDDGESWEPFEGFNETLAGKAFLTKLASSDADRREFAEKVIMAPFDAFVSYAKSDPTNSKKDLAQFDAMQAQMKKLFTMPDAKDESLEDKRARLAAEMAALEAGATPLVED